MSLVFEYNLQTIHISFVLGLGIWYIVTENKNILKGVYQLRNRLKIKYAEINLIRLEVLYILELIQCHVTSGRILFF